MENNNGIKQVITDAQAYLTSVLLDDKRKADIIQMIHEEMHMEDASHRVDIIEIAEGGEEVQWDFYAEKASNPFEELIDNSFVWGFEDDF